MSAAASHESRPLKYLFIVLLSAQRHDFMNW